MLRISGGNLDCFVPSAVFDICPFNDSQEQIHSAYAISEHVKITGLTLRIERLLEEFFFSLLTLNRPAVEMAVPFMHKHQKDKLSLFVIAAKQSIP